MRWTTFLAANVVGAALWVGLWSTIAYRFGKSVDILPFFLHHLALIAAVLIAALIARRVSVATSRRRSPLRSDGAAV